MQGWGIARRRSKRYTESSFANRISSMTRDEIIAMIRKNAEAIKAEGLTKLAIFGSRVRGDNRAADRRRAHRATAIDDIRGALAGQTKASFTDNMMLRLAVERLLETISEALRHIPVDMKAKEPKINWRRLADLGNWLRHAYHRTDPGILWDMIENDLEPLKIFVRRIA